MIFMKKRRGISAVVCAGLVASVIAQPVSAFDEGIFSTRQMVEMTDGSDYSEGNTVLFGDLNYDGSVTCADLVQMQKYLMGQNSSVGETVLPDINMDRAVNVIDLLLMKRSILQNKPVEMHWEEAELPTNAAFQALAEAESEIVVTSVTALEAYLQPVVDTETVAAYVEKYNADFFADNVLLLKPVVSCDATELAGVTYNQDGELYILYGSNAENHVETGETAYLLQVAMPKIQYHPEKVVWEDILPEVDYDFQKVTGTESFSSDSGFTATSTTELQTYLEEILTPEEIPAYLEKFDDTFFAENALLLYSMRFSGEGELDALQALVVHTNTESDGILIFPHYLHDDGTTMYDYLTCVSIEKEKMVPKEKIDWWNWETFVL
jgi:hypothetical protein